MSYNGLPLLLLILCNALLTSQHVLSVHFYWSTVGQPTNLCDFSHGVLLLTTLQWLVWLPVGSKLKSLTLPIIPIYDSSCSFLSFANGYIIYFNQTSPSHHLSVRTLQAPCSHPSSLPSSPGGGTNFPSQSKKQNHIKILAFLDYTSVVFLFC